MRKVSIAVMILVTFVFLFAVALTVQAGPPESVSGLWFYTPSIVGAREDGCNTHLTTFEDSNWQDDGSGDAAFVGHSTEDARVIIHCAGNWSFKGTVDFDEVEVNGRSGTLEMTVNGSRPDATADWFGYWTITGGGGELENLRGQGTFWGPGWLGDPETPGTIYYDGNIHFEPN